MTRQRGPWGSAAKGSISPRAPSTDDLDWQLRGRCRQSSNPDLWTPDHPALEAKSQRAITICHTCPVMLACRSWALSTRQRYGVWGGLSEGDRKSIWAGRPIKVRARRSRERGVA